MLNEVEKPAKGEKSTKIDSVEIRRAENGFIYCARSEQGPYSDEKYVYQTVDEALAAAKDDLTSPHMRGGKPAKDSREAMSAVAGKKSKTYSKERLFK